MKKAIYIAIAAFGLLIFILLVVGNLPRKEETQTTDMEASTFFYRDKKAGGAYAAYKMLPELFQRHSVQVVTKPFATSFNKNKELNYPGNAYIIVADHLYTSEKDIEALFNYVSVGNILFIAANEMDSALAKKLQVAVVDGEHQQFKKIMDAQRFKDAAIPVDTAFSYAGMISGSYFSQIDSTYVPIQVLGTNYKGKINFIRVNYAEGYIYVSLNPYTFTNYFLLHKQNVAALETQLSYLPADVGNLFWDDFYSHLTGPHSDGDFSEWQVLMRYPAMRWALWLAIVLMLIYVIFESKRRQRIIPDKVPLTNTSLEFVDAIGQLYYQQHDNYNLAHKMIVHFLEYVRTHYYINTHELNEQFVEALSKKSGVADTDISTLLQMIHSVQLDGHVSDEQLRELYNRIQLFYLNTK
ncbi:MAG TPA: DUF4350 domain-containing protein [Chitinophaga sp.]|uniref:DUF4350 domain-containing protein n=1 Tax=Chitinophaga sp. TaxID=1869181 RepID=UPI002BB8C8B9|nr:DUF4350 domain-containing protein [Chitinophaga sp.]HVI47426.1 DUF4350 domain-containing protein [Chitinophaga sp.]